LRNTAPPEFGDALLDLLQSRDPGKPLHGNSKTAMVQRGAQLFGIDLVAFAIRTVGAAMKAGGDGRDDNAICCLDRRIYLKFVIRGAARCAAPVCRAAQPGPD
jgi:hypothetical protein